MTITEPINYRPLQMTAVVPKLCKIIYKWLIEVQASQQLFSH